MAGRMKAQKGNHLRYGNYSFLTKFLSVLLVSLLCLINFPQLVYAAGGAYTIDWSAADPALNKGAYLPTYPKKTAAQKSRVTTIDGSGVVTAGGRLNGQTDDKALVDAVCFKPDTSTNDSVESLMPKDLMLGQIVPFEVKISVSGVTTPENGVMTFTGGWSTKTTSGGNFGYDPAYGVYSAFVDSSEGTDPGNDATVTKISSITANPGTNSEEIQGTIEVSGLQKGDIVVVEIWVVLKSTIGAKVTGNVQTRLIDAATVYSTPSAISTGNQTVPLLQVGDFFANVVDMSVTKTDSPDPVIAGGVITYNIKVTNNSTDTYANGVTVTDNVDSNLTNITSISNNGVNNSGTITWNLGGLAPRSSINLSYLATAPIEFTNYNETDLPDSGSITQPGTGTKDIVNKVSVNALNADKILSNNTYYQPTNVIARKTGPVISIAKSADTTSITQEGQIITYTYTLTNLGNVDLKEINFLDSLTSKGISLGPWSGDTDSNEKLGQSEIWTRTGTYTVTKADFGSTFLANTAEVSAKSNTDDTSSNTATASLNLPVVELNLEKQGTWNDANGNGFADVGETITYTFKITNNGHSTLTDIALTDAIAAVELFGDNISSLAPGASSGSFTGTYTLTQDDIDAGYFTNSATATASDGTYGTDSVSTDLPKPNNDTNDNTNDGGGGTLPIITLPKGPNDGLLPNPVENLIKIPQETIEKASKIEFYMDLDQVPKDATNYNNVQIAKKNLNLLGTCLQDAFDMTLMMRVTNTDGSVTVKPVDNAALLANITFLIPVTNDKLWNAPTLAAYFVADDGNVALLKSTKVTIDGKNYLEVANNHFSVYALCATCSGSPDIPKTGENDQSGTTLLGLLFLILAAAASVGLIWKRRQITSVK